ncbi:MAG TPA: general secretion pathway protein GspB [Spongiibacteraceae bacterium]
MSLILDALKKSEQQRQREKAPGLQSIHQPNAPSVAKSSRLWWLLSIIGACNIALLAYWFWRQQLPIAPAPQAQSIAKQEPTINQQQPSSAQNSTAQSQASAQTAVSVAPTAEFTRISPAPAQNQTAQLPATQRIEEVNELPDDVRNNLPAMTFSFHVYSENPQQRTIIINNRRMREGDEVSAGLQLQQITDDGVVLLFTAHRIHIGVLSGW